MQRDSPKRPPIKRQQKNAKRLNQKTSDERGNPEKYKRVHPKDLRLKKRQPQKTQRGLPKRPPMKKEETPKNAKVLVQKTSDEKGAIITKV
jgi:hypothetical protein